MEKLVNDVQIATLNILCHSKVTTSKYYVALRQNRCSERS
jgi:hypothetical protein